MTTIINLSLPTNIVYVTGTVNGIDKTFTLNGEYWTTTVDRVDNDTYNVKVLAVNNLGASAEYETIIYYGIHLITDRTEQDIINKTDKGFYNYSDFNRVESATQIISDNLTLYGYPVIIKTKNDWNDHDYPYEKEMKRYLNNINNCISRFGVPKQLFNHPTTMKQLTYSGANEIEKTLEKLDTLYENMKKENLYSGTIYGGDEW